MACIPGWCQTLNKPATNPKALPRPYRLLLLVLLTLCASLDPIASTSFYPALADVAHAFDTSRSIANLCSSLDFVGVASTALLWSYISQRNGRRPVLAVSVALVMLFNIVGATATSIQVLVTARVLSSASAAGIIITGIGAVGDMWETDEKGFAMGLYFMGPLASPALGPVVGGILVSRWGWQSLPSLIASMAGLWLLGIILILPETGALSDASEDIVQSNRPALGIAALRYAFGAVVHVFYHSLHALTLLRYPLILLLLFIAGFSYNLTSIFSITVQSTFSAPPYRYSASSIGLLFLPYAAGAILASLLGGKLSDYLMRARGPPLLPENRVRGNAVAACALQLLALPGLGWALQLAAPWWSILVPAFILGASCGLNLGIATTVLVELAPARATDLIALNSAGRNLCAALGGSVTQPLLDVIHAGWLFTGLCGLCAFVVAAFLAIKIAGKRWRETIWLAEHAT